MYSKEAFFADEILEGIADDVDSAAKLATLIVKPALLSS